MWPHSQEIAYAREKTPSDGFSSARLRTCAVVHVVLESATNMKDEFARLSVHEHEQLLSSGLIAAFVDSRIAIMISQLREMHASEMDDNAIIDKVNLLIQDALDKIRRDGVQRVQQSFQRLLNDAQTKAERGNLDKS